MCQLDQMNNAIYLLKLIQCVTCFSLDMADALLFFFLLSMFMLKKNNFSFLKNCNSIQQRRSCYNVLLDIYKNYRVLFGENNISFTRYVVFFSHFPNAEKKKKMAPSFTTILNVPL